MEHLDALDGPHGITEANIAKARQIQSEALKHVGGGAAPLGIWSRGCYWVESSTPTKVYKYGTYWKPIQCVG